jgi:ketosteroid isomerase-like protein
MTSDYAGRAGPYVGHEGMREYFRDVARVWDELRLTPTDFREVAGQVLVTGRVMARSPARTVAGSTGWVWRLVEGKVVYARVYGSADDAMRASRASPRRAAGGPAAGSPPAPACA